MGLIAALLVAGCASGAGPSSGPTPSASTAGASSPSAGAAGGGANAGASGVAAPTPTRGTTTGSASGPSASPATAAAPGSGDADGGGTAVASTTPRPSPDSAGPGEEATDGAPEPLPWSRRALRRLTLREKVGQMLMPMVLGDFSPEGTKSHDRIVKLIEDNGIGGVIVSVGDPTAVALKLNDLQSHARIPLLVGSDLEDGAGFRFSGTVHLPSVTELGGATLFPPLMAVGATGDPRYAYEVGKVTAQEARALGIQIPFAPVLDVNNNADNPVINVRSFGQDPQTVARMGVAFIRGLQDNGVIATGKHFPGHGDTDVDSHVSLPVIQVSRKRLESVELTPFRQAVTAGIGAIMIAHIAVPRITGNDLPSTLSPKVVTGILRDELGFRGLVFTDAMDMQAVAGRFPHGEASVRAVLAGADVILMPPSVDEAQDAIVEAVRSGRIPESRIDASVTRILAAKERVGLDRSAQVPLAELPKTVGIPAHTDLAREVADHSITVARNRRNLLPLLGTRSARVYSVTYRSPHDLLAGKYADAALRDVYPRLRTERLDENTRDGEYDDLARRVRRAQLVVVSLYVDEVDTGDGKSVLPDELTDFIKKLEKRHTPHIVISFGNPYLISEFPDVQAYMLAWGGGRFSQEAAVQSLFGDIPTVGHLPIAIPPFFHMGSGIQLGGTSRRADDR